MNIKQTLLLGFVVAGLAGWSVTARGQDAQPANKAPAAALAMQAEFFERSVRPVLVERCFGCHGPQKQRGGLRLDSRAGLLKGGDNGPVVELANLPASRLLKAIGYEDDDLQMPPKEQGKLPAEAIAALGKWIATGAFWPASESAADSSAEDKTHWAFQPIRRREIPSVRDAAWPRSPLDNFVLAKLEGQGMAPAPPADRVTLIRRATFDLVGLPPSEEEIAAFVADPAPDAFARVVDRLLDSPHYGERWGRYWLDVARYADTKGYVRLAEERRFLFAFTYRDYVVRAFNEDLPYDRFVVEQLAADQLTLGDDKRPLAALGFLTLGRRFTSNKHDIIDDRIDVVARGLLGLTVTCARCHDHKYDPIPAADYYSLYGVFATSEDPIALPLIETPRTDAATQAFERELATRRQAVDDYEPKQHAALANDLRARATEYLLKALEGRAPPQQPLPHAVGQIRQIVVDRWVEFIERAGADDPVFGAWHAFAALKPDAFEAGAAAIIAGWNVPNGKPAVELNAAIKNRFTAQPPKNMTDVARAYGELLVEVHQRWQNMVASSVAAGTGPPERMADPADESLRQVLYAADAPPLVDVQEAFWQYLYDQPIQDEIVRRRNAVNQHLAETALGPRRAHSLVELPAPPEPRVFVRGDPTRPGKTVPRQFLEVLSHASRPTFAPASGRMELARAIVDRDNPLTARVAVNRVWARHCGFGLVRSPSNFGRRGQPPTHSELLDHLAARFMDEGWSIKKLHRWIMLSSVYQQSSHDRSDYAARDPENRLLWKMNRRRLDFEALRDAWLWTAGRLDRTLGGPSVRLDAPTANRRTLYGLVDRQELPGMFATFDFASPDSHSAERYTTTVPQQALFGMNGPSVIQWSRDFAARADVQSLADPRERAAHMIQLAWGRAASEREIDLSVKFIEREAADRPTDATGSWEALAQTLLVANEFTYVD
jgi:hypothetical protein